MGELWQARPVRALVCSLLFWGVLALPAALAGSGALFPPQATVLLLSGLPGDVETENEYRDYLRGWLELVEADDGVRSLFVLCDDPAAISAPQRPETKLLKANRESFLGLARTFSGLTNPPVVVVWGHGGMQGVNPVFHVRGPRLTPADFKLLADGISPTASRWILMFRGSGNFARHLAGPGRQILSSESDTVFQSDPVGMSVFLKLARAGMFFTFEDLSEDAGRATAAWYADRNLARTEEPTLWLGTEKPRLLAPAGDQSPFASLGAQGTNGAPAQAQPAPASSLQPSTSNPAPAAGADESSTNWPAAWKQVQRVDPRKYAPADGVILRRRLAYTLATHPAISSEQEEFIQVLSPEGKRFGDFDLAFSPPLEEVEFLDCEVLSPAGKLTSLDPDAIREGGETAVGDYQPGRRKFFSLPGVVPGAVLHVRYRTRWEKFPLPQVSLEIPLGHELPVADCTAEVSVPKAAAFHFAVDQLSAPDPLIRQSTYGTTYAWHWENLPAQQHEVLASPHRQARLLVSTFPDWPAFADWYRRVSRLTDEVTPELAAIAAELTRDAKDDRARISAVYHYVTALRYVAVPLGVNSFRPHAAANVLQNGYGDCKDKANLFNTLLHALHLEAHLVLVPRFSQARDDLPGLSFNHAISQVILEGKPLWVDTTDDVCRFGFLPPGDPGRNVLVVDGQTNGLTRLPWAEPADNWLKLRGVASWPASNAPLSLKLDAEAAGFPDYELRSAAQSERASIPLLAMKFRPAAGAFALEQQRATAVSAVQENFAWQAEGTWLGGGTLNRNEWLLNPPFWLPREWDLALHHRQSPLFLNEGYPLTLDEEFSMSPPPGFSAAIPRDFHEVAESLEPPLRWRLEWGPAPGGGLVAVFHAELTRGELSADETPAFQTELRALFHALGAGARVSLSP